MEGFGWALRCFRTMTQSLRTLTSGGMLCHSPRRKRSANGCLQRTGVGRHDIQSNRRPLEQFWDRMFRHAKSLSGLPEQYEPPHELQAEQTHCPPLQNIMSCLESLRTLRPQLTAFCWSRILCREWKEMAFTLTVRSARNQ